MKLSKSLFALAIAAGFAGHASATMLTFDAASACTVTPCTDGPFGGSSTKISGSYGDTAEINVSYSNNLYYYSSGYGALSDVAWSGRNTQGSMTFTGLGGSSVMLDGFDFAKWLPMTSTANFEILDSGNNVIWNQGFVNGVNTASISGLNLVDTSLTLRWYASSGMETDLIGVDNVSVSAIPEPASVAMMLAGLGVMGAAARRRKSKSAAA